MRCLTPLGFVLMYSLVACTPAASSSTPTPTIDPTAEAEALASRPYASVRLAAPVMPADPSQADYGALTYYQICMACHGDRGQGLTDEWRQVYGDDSNCWRSRCHAANHPPEGFDLPRTSPPLLGAGTLLSYADAAELYARIIDTMPWWNPQSLSEEQAWNLTAHLMRARSELPQGITLDPARSPVIRLHQTPPPRGTERAGVTAVIVLLAVVAAMLAWRREARP